MRAAAVVWVVGLGVPVVAAACGLPTNGEGSGSSTPDEDGSVQEATTPGPDATRGDERGGEEKSATPDGDEDGGDDAGGGGDGGGDGPESEADAPTGDADGGPTCPGTSGPAMIDVGSFCIDATEVTQADYLLFVDSDPSVSSQPAVCSWNQSFVPTGQWPPTSTTMGLPVTSVNWCDAYVYCQWAGKRLCGQEGGGPVDPGNAANAADDQWFYACSHGGDGQHAYPYGNTYGATTCNGIDANGGMQIVEAPGSFPACVGGFPGIYDMSGNVREWEDQCNGTTGANDSCGERGGSVNYNAGQLTCADGDTGPRNDMNDHLGIRCCGP